MSWAERQADAQIEAQEEAAEDRAKRLEYEELIARITVLARQGLKTGDHARALIWIAKACSDAGFVVTSGPYAEDVQGG